MSKAPKQKQSQAEKALAETGVAQYNLTAPLLQRTLNQFQRLADNPEALSKRLLAIGRKDMFDTMEQNKTSISAATMGTDLASSTPTDQLANAISSEARKQGQEFSRKANVSLASVASGQLNQELRLAGGATNAINQVLAREQQIKAQNRAKITESAFKSAGLVIGQLGVNARNPDTNIFGRSNTSSAATTTTSPYSVGTFAGAAGQPGFNSNSAFGGFSNSNVGGFTPALSGIAPFSNR